MMFPLKERAYKLDKQTGCKKMKVSMHIVTSKLSN